MRLAALFALALLVAGCAALPAAERGFAVGEALSTLPAGEIPAAIAENPPDGDPGPLEWAAYFGGMLAAVLIGRRGLVWTLARARASKPGALI